MPAQVFEDATAKPVAGATVVVLENDKALESALTDDKGFYTTVKTLAGHSYTFTCSKTGFVTQSKKAVYESAGSLPLFALVAK